MIRPFISFEDERDGMEEEDDEELDEEEPNRDDIVF